MNPTSMIDGRPVGAAVVTYFPDEAFVARCAAVAREFAPVIVVDNSAEPAVQAHLRATCANLGWELIPNDTNLGLAGALNQAFQAHTRRGIEWAVAFDQDSTPEEGFGAALTSAATRVPRAAVVGANWTDDGRPQQPSLHLRRHPHLPLLYRRTAATADLEDVTCVIASGSLFNLEVWSQISGFDEGLFLDLVDADYCLRAARSGRPVRVAAGARLRHRRGAKQPVAFAGRTFFPAFMPPLRLRYLFRNRLRLLSRHAGYAPHLLSFECAYAAKVIAEIIFLEDRKAKKLAACARGVRDGLIGRTGRIGS